MKLLLLAALFVLFFSCRNKNQKSSQSIPPGVVNDSVVISPGGNAINFFNNYQTIDSGNPYLMFPLELGNAKGDDESYELYSKSRGGEGTLYWNIAFYNSLT